MAVARLSRTTPRHPTVVPGNPRTRHDQMGERTTRPRPRETSDSSHAKDTPAVPSRARGTPLRAMRSTGPQHRPMLAPIPGQQRIRAHPIRARRGRQRAEVLNVTPELPQTSTSTSSPGVPKKHPPGARRIGARRRVSGYACSEHGRCPVRSCERRSGGNRNASEGPPGPTPGGSSRSSQTLADVADVRSVDTPMEHPKITQLVQQLQLIEGVPAGRDHHLLTTERGEDPRRSKTTRRTRG